MCIYGDPGYRRLNVHLVSPWQGVRLSPEQEEFNKRMKSLRVAIEWTFGQIFNKFQYLEWKHGQKHLQQLVGIMFKVAVLLYSALVRLEGGEVNEYFEIAPPRFELIFHGPPGPVPVGSDVENEGRQTWRIQRTKAMLIKIV